MSEEVANDWASEFNRSGRNSRFSYAKARVFLKISPAQLAKDFPDAEKPDQLISKAIPVKGTVGRFKGISDTVMKGLNANAKDRSDDRMILINYGEEGSGGWFGVCIGVFLWLLAVPWFAPLGWFLFQRFKAAQPAPTNPTQPPA